MTSFNLRYNTSNEDGIIYVKVINRLEELEENDIQFIYMVGNDKETVDHISKVLSDLGYTFKWMDNGNYDTDFRIFALHINEGYCLTFNEMYTEDCYFYKFLRDWSFNGSLVNNDRFLYNIEPEVFFDYNDFRI